MASIFGVPGSSDSARKELRRRRSHERRLVMRHRWFAGSLATVISAALVFGGGVPAVADDATVPPAPVESASPAPEESAPADEATPPAEEATPPAEEAAPPPGRPPRPWGRRPRPPTRPPPPPTIPTPPRPRSRPSPSDASTLEAADAAAGHRCALRARPRAHHRRHHGQGRLRPHGHHRRHPPRGSRAAAQQRQAGGPNGTRPDGVAGTADGWAKCTSDAQGDCSFTVPNTQAGPPAGREPRRPLLDHPVQRSGRLLRQPQPPHGGDSGGAGEFHAVPLPHRRRSSARADVLVAGRERLHALVGRRADRLGRHLAAVPQEPGASRSPAASTSR